jgi:hypothetical protein
MTKIVNQAPGFWGGSYTLISNEKAALGFRMKRELRRRGFSAERGTLPVLTSNPVGSGGAVTTGYPRVAAPTPPATVGGKVTLETVSTHAGVTTAADEAIIDSWATLTTQPTYVLNRDGNPRANAGG